MNTHKTIVPLLLQTLYSVMVYLALYNKHPGAINVVQFWTFFAAGGSLLMLNPAIWANISSRHNGRPDWAKSLSALMKLVAVGAFIWSGWFWVGAAYLIHLLMVVSLENSE